MFGTQSEREIRRQISPTERVVHVGIVLLCAVAAHYTVFVVVNAYTLRVSFVSK